MFYSSETVGVIVRLEKEVFNVLSMTGKIVECRPGVLQKRRLHKLTGAFDSYHNTIHRKDMVTVVDGPHSGRSGEIRHLYRNCAFLHSLDYFDNGGIFVCKTKHLKLAGGTKTVISTSDLNANASYMSPRIRSPMHSPDDKGSFVQENGRMIRDRELIGSTIKITKGPYKGNIGIVKDATSNAARIELHTSCQTISVDRNHIATVSAPSKDGSISSYSKTPTHLGSQTPIYQLGNKTPLIDAGSRTPVHFGSMTPVHDGSRTPNVSTDWDSGKFFTKKNNILFISSRFMNH